MFVNNGKLEANDLLEHLLINSRSSESLVKIARREILLSDSNERPGHNTNKLTTPTGIDREREREREGPGHRNDSNNYQ